MIVQNGVAQVTIRPMQVTDVEAVGKIDRRSFATPWSTQAYLNELSHPIAKMFVALYEGRIVGYVGIQVIMDEGHITTIAVDPDLRGQRIGERLLVVALEEAIRRGAEHMTLEVRRSNVAAQKLYAKYGFVKVSARRGYYSDHNEDADILWAYHVIGPAWQQLFAQNRMNLP
jgi:ribosomal-protein-alanine N-acetyltransferase